MQRSINDINNLEKKKSGILYIVATPIGNLSDITIRALEVLREVDLVAAEDTRHTKKLLTHHNICSTLTSFHEHNKEIKAPLLVKKVCEGKYIALVTDAGTPCISDPGYYLVNLACQKGCKIVPIPGCSAVVTSLSVSGISGDSFMFTGYIPRKLAKRKLFLESLGNEPNTVVLFESPRRIIKSLEELEKYAGNRRIFVAREITKIHEQFLHGSVKEILKYFQLHPEHVKGEFTIVMEGYGKQQVQEEIRISRKLIMQDLENLLKEEKINKKKVIDLISKRLGIHKKLVYKIATKM